MNIKFNFNCLIPYLIHYERCFVIRAADPGTLLSPLASSPNILYLFFGSVRTVFLGYFSHVSESWGDISLQSIDNKKPHWMFEVAGAQKLVL
jgi:hypothetical protein